MVCGCQIPSQVPISITKSALSLYRQYASYIGYALTILGLACHHGPIPFERDGMPPPGGPIPIPFHGTVEMGYPISFRPTT